jgi:hypothetical protein
MISAGVRAPASTSRYVPAGKATFDEKPRCITGEIRKVTPGFIGTLLVYEK